MKELKREKLKKTFWLKCLTSIDFNIEKVVAGGSGFYTWTAHDISTIYLLSVGPFQRSSRRTPDGEGFFRKVDKEFSRTPKSPSRVLPTSCHQGSATMLFGTRSSNRAPPFEAWACAQHSCKGKQLCGSRRP